MPAESFLRLLQFSDGLFPAGGYAHSFGLETLVQSGCVQNAADVSAFLETYLESSAAPTDAVAVLCAAKYSREGDLVALIHLDQLLDALKPAAETREASRQMGRQTLRVLNQIASIDIKQCHSERAEPAAAGQRRSDEESLFGSTGRSFSSDISAAQPALALAPEEPIDSSSHQPLVTSHPLPVSSRSEAVRSDPARVARRSRGISLRVTNSPSIDDEESRLGGRSFSSDISARREAPSARGEVSASLQASHSPLPTSDFCSLFAASVESGETPCHHPAVFGLAAAIHGWEPRETASAFLYATSAMIAGAALRLLPLGQLAGQRILAQAGSLIATLVETTLDKTEGDMWSFTPELEIAAMLHESLDGRLFRS